MTVGLRYERRWSAAHKRTAAGAVIPNWRIENAKHPASIEAARSVYRRRPEFFKA